MTGIPLAYVTFVIDLPGTPPELLVRALVHRGRGITNDLLGALEKAMDDFTDASELPGAPADWVERAVTYRGSVKTRIGDGKKAIPDYTSAMEVRGAPVDLIAEALLRRGLTKSQLGDHAEAIDDYTAALGLSGASNEQIAKTWIWRTTSCSACARRSMAKWVNTAIELSRGSRGRTENRPLDAIACRP